MVLAKQSLIQESLQDTLVRVQNEVRKQPAEPKHRIFLFQLYCVLGEWQKALNQLNVLREMDAETLPMAQTYQEAIQCEALRKQVFAGERTPLFFGEPEPWLALMVEALKVSAKNEHDKAEDLRARALEQAPATGGRIDGVGFSWLMDADPRLGPILEAVINGRYYWVPLYHVRLVELEKPEDLRDLIWLPANFTWVNGGQTVGLIPVRYPGSEQSADDAIRMARKTEWEAVTDTIQLGRGQRLLATDIDDYPLLDVRKIELEGSAAETTNG